ncbi:MAG: endonuclease III [Chitinivibrionales bacterium]|nr:endonuclease III [Chitinivibrionales bacterium]MBD3357358.1 endonuclease III [Chitinivibrionales bacterium]
MAKRYRILKREFRKHRMPIVDLIAAHTHDPFKVLTSTILSARTRDETTTAASGRLFAHASSPSELQRLSEPFIRELIYPVGFANAKAKHLKQLPEVLEREFGGRIPETVEELTRLPGVGRKTANLVVAVAFNKPAVCVDTHVHRITNRWGYVKTKTPYETEMRLREILPKRYWTTINAYLVSFGQHTCKPVNPRCDGCPLYDYCERAGVRTKFDKPRNFA